MIQFLIKLCSLALKEGTVRSDITQLSYSEWNLNPFFRVRRNWERQCYSLLNKLITKSKTKLCQWYAINVQYFLLQGSSTCPPLRLNYSLHITPLHSWADSTENFQFSIKENKCYLIEWFSVLWDIFQITLYFGEPI